MEFTVDGGRMLSVLKDPNERPPEIVTELKRGSTVRAIDSTPYYGFNNKPYVKVETDNYHTGYILQELLREKEVVKRGRKRTRVNT